MLKAILDNPIKECILLIILEEKEAYAREIALRLNKYLLSIQKQLKKLEYGGVLCSKLMGRTRIYSFNPRYPFLAELKALLKRSIDFMNTQEKEALFVGRTRPRRSGKPI